jgi:hypothetical protein
MVCIRVPVIKNPAFIGVDSDNCFMLDDLANLFFFTNFQAVVFTPPLVYSMLPCFGAPGK